VNIHLPRKRIIPEDESQENEKCEQCRKNEDLEDHILILHVHEIIQNIPGLDAGDEQGDDDRPVPQIDAGHRDRDAGERQQSEPDENIISVLNNV
jgi:hypothetical protein